MPKILEMYAFVMEDSGPDDEGIMGMSTGLGWVPLVGADMARVDSLRPIAVGLARSAGKRVKLLHFTERTELEIIQ